MDQKYISYATLANIQELVFRVMKGVCGNDIGAKTNDNELSEDIAASINQRVTTTAGAAQ